MSWQPHFHLPAANLQQQQGHLMESPQARSLHDAARLVPGMSLDRV